MAAISRWRLGQELNDKWELKLGSLLPSKSHFLRIPTLENHSLAGQLRPCKRTVIVHVHNQRFVMP